MAPAAKKAPAKKAVPAKKATPGKAPAAKKTIPIADVTTKASSSRAVVAWEEQMRKVATGQVDNVGEVGASRAINVKSGVMTIDDAPVPDNELSVIILGYAHANLYYTGKFDPKSPAPPGCYAFSAIDGSEDGMAAHAEAEDPQGDANGLCAGCWANEFGTADTGRGKACKNTLRLMVISADSVDSVEALKSAEVRTFSVPPTSVKQFKKFVKGVLADIERPTFGIKTNLKVVPDDDTQWKAFFTMEELVQFDQDLWDAMQTKIREGGEGLTSAYPKAADIAAKAPRGKPAAGRPAAKKSGAARKAKF